MNDTSDGTPQKPWHHQDGTWRDLTDALRRAQATRLPGETAPWLRNIILAIFGFLYYWLKEPVLVFVGFYMISAAIAQPFYVPSGSMQPTLAIGDLLLATKYSYGYNRYSLPFAGGTTPQQTLFAHTPEQGDVIVFRKPGNESVTLVKRVVGLPGDHLQMRGGRLWINGQELAVSPAGTGQVEDGPGEPAPGAYLTAASFIETLPNGRTHIIFKKGQSPYDDTVVYVVPQGHLFVMGDNRDDSADSRFPIEDGGVSYLPIANVMGKAQVVVASVDFVNASGVWAWPLQWRVKRLFTPIH